MRIVLDTNILFAGLSYRSPYFPIIEGIYKRTFALLVSMPILLEYEEILQRSHSVTTMQYFFEFLNASDNVLLVNRRTTFNCLLKMKTMRNLWIVPCVAMRTFLSPMTGISDD